MLSVWRISYLPIVHSVLMCEANIILLVAHYVPHRCCAIGCWSALHVKLSYAS
jgi:hypothetical protein